MKQRGVSLLEMLVVMVLVGIMSMVAASRLQNETASSGNAWSERQTLNNRAIARGLLSYAGKVSTTASLPTAYTNAGTSVFSAPLNPTDVTLQQLIKKHDVNEEEINDDGTPSENVRVYQVVTGLTYNSPLNVQAGALATLTYQYGVVYSTTCRRADTTCNKSPLPGASVQITSANHGTWTTTAPDFSMAAVSTLDLQMDWLSITSQRLNRVRDAMLTYFAGKRLAAAANDGTNYYPNDGGSAVGSASSNQGCWYSWIDLSATTVLDQVGLSKSEFGKTAWGGRIEYCRKYDATGSSTADAAPHYGAVRINKNVSTAAVPDTSVSSNNIILTF